jgi:hypothetical protein
LLFPTCNALAFQVDRTEPNTCDRECTLLHLAFQVASRVQPRIWAYSIVNRACSLRRISRGTYYGSRLTTRQAPRPQHAPYVTPSRVTHSPRLPVSSPPSIFACTNWLAGYYGLARLCSAVTPGSFTACNRRTLPLRVDLLPHYLPKILSGAPAVPI